MMRAEIIAPGGRCEASDLDTGASYLMEFYDVTFPDNLLGDHLLYANTDDSRLAHLKNALSGDADILFALRGGCGTSRMVNHLLSVGKPKHKKVVVGYSDITALMLFLYQHWQWKPIHGPVLRNLALSHVTEDVQVAMKTLFAKRHVTVTNQISWFDDSSKIETISAPMTGGNLSVAQRSIGTPWQLRGAEHIVCLEDVNEPPYRVAELLDHLNHARCLDGAKAIIFGQFTSGHLASDDQFNRDLQFVLDAFSKSVNVPVFGGLSMGHVANNYPFQYGQLATIASHKDAWQLSQRISV